MSKGNWKIAGVHYDKGELEVLEYADKLSRTITERNLHIADLEQVIRNLERKLVEANEMIDILNQEVREALYGRSW